MDGSKGCLRSFAALKQQHRHLKTILSVGGGGHSENFAAVARDPALRHAFASTARDLCLGYGLDGIDIDWEHPSDPRQGEDYISLLAALRTALPAPRFTITSALPAGAWPLQHIALARACQHLDLINLMAYDFSGPWTPHAGHHAQLRSPARPHSDAARLSCHAAVEYLLVHGVPSRKILLGVPCYGRSFLGCQRPGQACSAHAGEEGTFEYRDLPRPGSIEYVDEETGAAYCVGGDGGFVSYDNARTVGMKARFVRERQLAGLFYWTGTGDREAWEESLVVKGYESLHGGA
ncbi:hypothetical protein LTR04_000998 [Oleoguttula sp. CCFEE 6159]|nr:hypothetical protein LTR04_000998 [Oleoguttula sp. CCFEE 6159]